MNRFRWIPTWIRSAPNARLTLRSHERQPETLNQISSFFGYFPSETLSETRLTIDTVDSKRAIQIFMAPINQHVKSLKLSNQGFVSDFSNVFAFSKFERILSVRGEVANSGAESIKTWLNKAETAGSCPPPM